jgi:P27 family predicted phage terminase small subunit
MIKANPAVAMLADADRRFKSYLVEFGLTPAARSKVNTLPDEEEGRKDPLAQYFA